jgi:hypothetical protein
MLGYIVSYLMSIVMVGLVSFITAGFDFAWITSSAFLFDIGLTAIANLITMVSTTFMRIDEEEERNPKITELAKAIDTLYNRYVEDKTFTEYLYKFVNRPAKIQAWKDKIGIELLNVEQHAKYKDLSIYNGSDELAKTKNKYCRTHLKYEQWLSEDYINKNIDRMNVKYEYISKRMILGSIKQADSRTRFTRRNKQMFNDLAPKFVLSWGLTLFVASFTYQWNDWSSQTIINSIAKLISLFLNFGNGWSYGKRFAENYIISDLQEKKGIIEDYLKVYNIKMV